MVAKVIRQGTGPDGNPFKIEDHTAAGRKRRRIVCGPQGRVIIYVDIKFSGDDQAVFNLLLDASSTGGQKFSAALRAKGFGVLQLPRHPNGAVMVYTAASGPAVAPFLSPPSTTIASQNRRTVGNEAETVADGQRFVREGVVVDVGRVRAPDAPSCWEFRRDHARERENHGRGTSGFRKIEERDVTITRLSRENVMLRTSLEFALHQGAKVRGVRAKGLTQSSAT